MGGAAAAATRKGWAGSGQALQLHKQAPCQPDRPPAQVWHAASCFACKGQVSRLCPLALGGEHALSTRDVRAALVQAGGRTSLPRESYHIDAIVVTGVHWAFKACSNGKESSSGQPGLTTKQQAA